MARRAVAAASVESSSTMTTRERDEDAGGEPGRCVTCGATSVATRPVRGDPLKAVREFPHGQFGAGVLGHGAGVDFLLGVGQREGIDVQLGGQADENRQHAQPAQRRGRQRAPALQGGRCAARRRWRRWPAERRCCKQTLSAASRAEPISPKMERDEKPAAMMQIEGSSSSASSRIRSPSKSARGGQHGQQANRAGGGGDRDQRPGAHQHAAHAAARRRAFAEQLDEIEERLHEWRADALLHQRDGFALDPKEEPRGRHGEQQAGKDEQAGEGSDEGMAVSWLSPPQRM